MSTAKEIRTKIGSIKNTQKITRAMEMVAASKMRKAQNRMQVSKPYSEKIRQVVGHVAKGHSEYRHPFLDIRDVNRVGFIVVSTDRGLCGGLNSNIFRHVIGSMKAWHDKDIPIDVCTIGSKAYHFFNRIGGNIIAHAEHLGDVASVESIIGVVRVLFDAYIEKKLDKIFLVYNQFINTMSQKPFEIEILPLVPADAEKLDYHWDYIYEPDSKELIDELLKRYIEMQVYQAVAENFACEQASRMVAMKNATDNAGKLIDDLQLAYNKARQASITKEIAEIVGGAEAV
ncbi:MAG: F0F1 ATP synthase subunit gamma [Pseudomonadota bacterium]